jgi:DNA-nicking Smr family endonuclease
LTDNISKKDKKDWETFLSSNEKLPNKDLKLKKILLKTRSIDLHGYTLDEANKLLNDFIKNHMKKK